MEEMTKRPLTFLSFWSINDKLDIVKLVNQLNELKQSGLDGVVFHPRNYPNEPEYLGSEYMCIVSELILYAKSIGMKFWIYDENGWPSGTAGGKVLAEHPELRCQWIEMKNANEQTVIDEINMHEQPHSLYSFRIDEQHVFSEHSDMGEGAQLILHSKKAVSSLDPAASAYFIEITHERYKNGLNPQAFEYITGFFSDEVAFLDGGSVAVQYGAIPWTDRLLDQYEARYGEDLLPLLPLLFIKGEGHENLRTRFWELLTDALNDGFYHPIKAWCQANGKEFTAHVKAEESPFFQLAYSGSCFDILKNTTVPAIDALERYPGNNYYPRIPHSIAVQFGNGNSLVEAMGGSGWGTKPEDFVDYMMWLAEHGINNFVFHLNHLRLNTMAVHDWPPSIPCHMTWKDAFPTVLAEIKRRAAELPDLMSDPDLLIVTPTRGIMSSFEPQETMQINEHDGSNIPDTLSGRMNRNFLAMIEECHATGIHYELTEERAIEQFGIIEGDRLFLGKRSYRNILIADGCKWSCELQGMPEKLFNSGITILHSSNWQSAFQAKGGKVKHNNIPRESVKLMQTPWKAEMPKYNLFIITWDRLKSVTHFTIFNVEGLDAISRIDLVLLDAVKEVCINRKAVRREFEHDEYVYRIPLELLIGENDILLEIITEVEGEKPPIAFLRGDFIVQSVSDYLEKDENQVISRGPFFIKPPTELDYCDLIASGLPFCNMPVKVSKHINIATDFGKGKIILTDIKADAAKVYVDGQDEGWCWGPEWSVQLSNCLEQGEHEVVLYLIPSTYNVYGPHHHVDGDRHLMSPAQYEGVKNFADRIDAPEITKGDDWHFVRFYVKGDLLLQESDHP